MAAPDLRADHLVENTTQAAVEDKAKLQKHFGRFDIFFFLICTLVGSTRWARSPTTGRRRSPGWRSSASS